MWVYQKLYRRKSQYGGVGGGGVIDQTLWVMVCWPKWVCVCVGGGVVCVSVCMDVCICACVRLTMHIPVWVRGQCQDTCHNSNPTLTYYCLSNVQKPSIFGYSLCQLIAKSHSLTSSTRLWLEVSVRPSRAENTLSRVSTSAALRSNRSLCSDRSFFHSSRLCWMERKQWPQQMGFFFHYVYFTVSSLPFPLRQWSASWVMPLSVAQPRWPPPASGWLELSSGFACQRLGVWVWDNNNNNNNNITYKHDSLKVISKPFYCLI